MIRFQEVIYYETKLNNNNGQRQYDCPKCSGKISWNRIPCPEHDSKCLAVHNGYICNLCRTVFSKVKDDE